MAKKEMILLPESRLIHHSFFSRSIYTNDKGQEGKPQYTGELGLDPKVLNDVFDKLEDYVAETWGKDALDEFFVDPREGKGDIRSPFLVGDKLQAKREKAGKKGDAYEGLLVLRPNTQFNKHGDKDDGGIQVFLPDLEEVTGGTKSEIYYGCYGHALVSIDDYDTNGKGVKMYLHSFQKTRDGERLMEQSDHSGAFAAVKDKESDGGRRARRTARGDDD